MKVSTPSPNLLCMKGTWIFHWISYSLVKACFPSFQSPDFINVFLKSQIFIFCSSSVANNMEGCLISFHFHFFFVGRFALIIFWRIATSATLQNCKNTKNKKKKHSGRITHHPALAYHRTLSNIFPFFNQIEQFLCHCMCKLKGYKCFFNLRSKGATQRTHEESE